MTERCLIAPFFMPRNYEFIIRELGPNILLVQIIQNEIVEIGFLFHSRIVN